jgi:hypothetical protein
MFWWSFSCRSMNESYESWVSDTPRSTAATTNGRTDCVCSPPKHTQTHTTAARVNNVRSWVQSLARASEQRTCCRATHVLQDVRCRAHLLTRCAAATCCGGARRGHRVREGQKITADKRVRVALLPLPSPSCAASSVVRRACTRDRGPSARRCAAHVQCPRDRADRSDSLGCRS